MVFFNAHENIDNLVISWSDVANKPTEFNPEAHTHTEAEITDLDKYTKEEVNALNRFVPMKVKATEDLVAGTCVKYSGYNSGENAIEVEKVLVGSDICIGITGEDMTNGEFGDVIVRGLLEGIDTSAYSVGTILYVNSDGLFSDVKPGIAYQAIAYVLRSHSNNGSIMINVSEPVDNYSTSEVDNLLAHEKIELVNDTPVNIDFTGMLEVQVLSSFDKNGAWSITLDVDGSTETITGGGAFISSPCPTMIWSGNVTTPDIKCTVDADNIYQLQLIIRKR